MKTFEDLFEYIGVDVRVYHEYRKLFIEAFTHRSAVNERTKFDRHNERLEFLGDAVLELITTEFLYKNYTEKTEGELTSFRSALVKKETLAGVAREIRMGTLLKMSEGEARSGGREKDYLLANLMESFIGALYLSVGYEQTARFVTNFILSRLDEILATKSYVDAKSEFQELTQGVFGITPNYRLLRESGKDHEKVFVMGAFLDEVKVGEGSGSSKKEAQANSASDALKKKDAWQKKFKKK